MSWGKARALSLHKVEMDSLFMDMIRHCNYKIMSTQQTKLDFQSFLFQMSNGVLVYVCRSAPKYFEMYETQTIKTNNNVFSGQDLGEIIYTNFDRRLKVIS